MRASIRMRVPLYSESFVISSAATLSARTSTVRLHFESRAVSDERD